MQASQLGVRAVRAVEAPLLALRAETVVGRGVTEPKDPLSVIRPVVEAAVQELWPSVSMRRGGSDKYILDGHTPVLEPDLMVWARWFEGSRDKRIVARTEIADAQVSTVFLGLDHGWFQDGPAILFETMVFDGPWSGEMERCATWDQALEMHARMVALVQTAKPEPDDE
jgi:hypothetical protein